MSDGVSQVISALIGSITTIVLAVLTNRWANERFRRERHRARIEEEGFDVDDTVLEEGD